MTLFDEGFPIFTLLLPLPITLPLFLPPKLMLVLLGVLACGCGLLAGGFPMLLLLLLPLSCPPIIVFAGLAGEGLTLLAGGPLLFPP